MNELIGKTIKSVQPIGSYDFYGDDERVTEVIKISCTDGTDVYLMADGGDTNFYCSIYTSKYNESTNNFDNFEGVFTKY